MGMKQILVMMVVVVVLVGCDSGGIPKSMIVVECVKSNDQNCTKPGCNMDFWGIEYSGREWYKNRSSNDSSMTIKNASGTILTGQYWMTKETPCIYIVIKPESIVTLENHLKKNDPETYRRYMKSD